ncbi:MAG: IPT/TIG domain-containing protein [Candidatus Eisenbacteria bacterium]|nr:IPT/TIG domain-containing protein [Candidatus Eisenbacteria bacterium]
MRPSIRYSAPLILLPLLVLCPRPASAYWAGDPTVNHPVTIMSGDDTGPSVAMDRYGSYYVAWRNTGGIYVQRFLPSGDRAPMWPAGGVQVASVPFPGVVKVVVGDYWATVVFQDMNPLTLQDVRLVAQRVDSTGALPWGSTGVVLAEEPNGGTHGPVLTNFTDLQAVPDGRGGVILCQAGIQQHDYPSAPSDTTSWIDVAACDADGVPSSMRIEQRQRYGGSPLDKRDQPRLIEGGPGKAILAFRARRPGDGGHDLLARGILTWTSMGVGSVVTEWASNTTVCSAAGSRSLPSVAGDGLHGVIVAWEDGRSSPSAVFAQRVDSLGTPQWAADGVAVCPASGAQTRPAAVPDGAGGAIVGWLDHRSGTHDDVYAQRLGAATGGALWDPGAVATGVASSTKSSPVMAASLAGSAHLLWEDSRNGAGDIYGAFVNTDGAVAGSSGGSPVCTAANSQHSPALAVGADGQAVATWVDHRSGTNDDLYAALTAPPVITGLYLATCGTAGVSRSILGHNFTGASEVRFAGNLSPGFTVVSDSVITATVPAGGGPGFITVVTPAGTAGGPGVPASYFYTLGVTSISPTGGPVGTTVTIQGFFDLGAMSVEFFSGVPAVSTGDEHTITTTVPAGARTGVLQLGCYCDTTVLAVGYLSSTDTFTVAPVVDSFAPASGFVGTTLQVKGRNFLGASAVNFNGVSASFSVVNDDSLTATVPAGATTGPITVSHGSWSGSSSTSFTVLVPPTIALFVPAAGPVGTSVKVRGTILDGASSVTFNGTAAAFTMDSSTVITATVPAGATTGQIAVTTPGGTATSSGSFFVGSAPTVSSFSPGGGPVGTSVTIGGTNFVGATEVRFYLVAATSFTVNNATQITATVPAGATTGPIRVVNPVGTGTSADSFFVGSAPTVASFSPTSGTAGTSVTVTGTNFTSSTAVAFNGSSASFTVDNVTQITATVPGGATTGPISVTNPAGTGTSAGGFFIGSAPVVSSFAPTFGLPRASVTVTGANFTGATALSFNGTSASFSVNTSTQITATVPGGATTGPISVTNPAGTGSSASSFFVGNGPTVSSFSPTSGTVGTSVTLAGTNFTGASSVAFNGTAASFTVNSDVSISTTVPGGATTGPISVTNPAGTGASASSFFVGTAPVVSLFVPAGGPVGTSVKVRGSNFTGSTSVTFNGTSATFTVDSSTVITATVPVGATTGPIAVTNPAGTGSSGSSYFVGSAPTISTFSPPSGLAGTSVTITGTGFTGVTAVAFNGTSASFTVNSATQITATVPAGATTGPVSATNPAGTGTSSPSFFVGSPPTISSFTPDHGTVGASVVITGTNFTGVNTVVFWNTIPASFTVNSAIQITATVPAGATTGVLSVNNPAGMAFSATNFHLPPTLTSFSPSSGPVNTTVTLTGTNFTGATGVTFNGTPATIYSVTSNIQMTARVPVGATSGTIAVTTPGGTATSASSFTVTAGPAITSFLPLSGVVGASVTINGVNFTGATVVKFGEGAYASFTVNSATQITATVPPGARTASITVVTPAGTALSSGSFTVTVPLEAPFLASFTPASGPPGTQVTVNGGGFLNPPRPITQVWFGGKAASSFTVLGPLQLRAVVPTNAPLGAVAVAVSNSAGTGTTSSLFLVTVPTDVERVPVALALEAPRPNPSRGEVDLSFGLTRSGRVELAVYSVSGARVRQLVSEDREPGAHTTHWDGRGDLGQPLASGVYLVRMEAEGRLLNRRIVLMK